jgi:hypothetical protein
MGIFIREYASKLIKTINSLRRLKTKSGDRFAPVRRSFSTRKIPRAIAINRGFAA